MADFEYVSHSTAAQPSTKKPAAKDFSYHYSRVTAARSGSSVKKFYKYFGIPGIGNLAGGLPNASLFPYDTLEAQIAQPERFKPTQNDPPNDLSTSLASTSIKRPDTSASAHLTVPHSSSIDNPLQKIDLTTALQYGTAQGYPPLYSFLRTFAREHLHPNIPYEGGAEVILTCGNTDGFGKTLEALSNVWSEERDWVREREGILVEEFAYMNAVQAARPRGLQVTPVKIDFEGMLPTGPGGLEDVLENWDESKGKRPHLMYTVTIGQNPTSGTLSPQRRKDIYALCCKYDVMIIEDDPYWYLQFPSAVGRESEARGTPLPAAAPIHKFEKSSGFPFLDSLVPSYLNFDYEGRVIRLDTFSKTVAPGCRLGWITAQPAIVERLLRITETSTQQPSGFVQSMIAELVMGPQPAAAEFAKKSRAEQASFTGWKADGWVRWLEGLRGTYERRMNRMCTYLEEGRYLLKQQTPIKQAESDWAVISKTKMYSFDWPRGGMFVWVKIHFENHPLAGKVSGAELSQSMWTLLAQKPHLVLTAPGAMFSPTPEILEKEGFKYLRLCFAAESEEKVDECSKRFATGVKAFWEIKDKKDLPVVDEDSIGTEGELLDMGINWAC
ncbi:Aromatic amino acid aminotransferase [Hyphodiscus hymeniophilus]|uniref:Aromatic amino acid aminotransferase n=1 Tax=Hyphodiscus hymeniophilus TaxID=353542 RepID=A0A9P7AUI4_9HELO|nr:Aromatic amino acid aminotransferase [Hyphodiscus hymeniophilus]